jgi:acetyl esterase
MKKQKSGENDMGLVKWILSSFLNGAEKKKDAQENKEIAGIKRKIKNRGGDELEMRLFPAKRIHAPLLVNIHGGGFVTGSPAQNDVLCDLIRRKADINVCSVSYRLAPHVVYPKATEDVMDQLSALFQDTRQDFNRKAVFLLGHDAGGNIALSVAIALSVLPDLRVRGILAADPILDARSSTVRPPVEGIKGLKEWTGAVKSYFADPVRALDAGASPVLLSLNEAAKLPDTFLVTAGKSPYKTDGMALFERLKEAKSNVTHLPFPEALHDFVEMSYDETNPGWKKKTPAVRAEQKKYAEQAIAEMCNFMVACASDIKKSK